MNLPLLRSIARAAAITLCALSIGLALVARAYGHRGERPHSITIHRTTS